MKAIKYKDWTKEQSDKASHRCDTDLPNSDTQCLNDSMFLLFENEDDDWPTAYCEVHAEQAALMLLLGKGKMGMAGER